MTLKNNLNNIEMNKLNAYLEKLQGSNIRNMSLLDGFLVAIVCSPKLILPNTYIVEIIGDADIEYQKSDEFKEFIELTIRHWTYIMVKLKRQEPYMPIIPKDNLALINDWTDGFVKGMGLNLNPWIELLKDQNYGKSLIPILYTEHEDKYRPVSKVSRREETYLDKDSQALSAEWIPGSIQNIYEYFKCQHKLYMQEPISYKKVETLVDKKHCDCCE